MPAIYVLCEAPATGGRLCRVGVQYNRALIGQKPTYGNPFFVLGVLSEIFDVDMSLVRVISAG